MPRRLGQHFLKDRAILGRIVAALDPHPDDVVVEIGPGQGALTRELAGRVGMVIGIEADRRLADQLREQGTGNGEQGVVGTISVIEGDALEIDFHEVIRNQTVPPSLFPVPPFKLVGNIPYYITSPLIEKALEPPRASVIVFLVQREVADRLVAAPGSKTYGALTVGVQAVARVERLFVVKAGAFSPPPKVDSAVVRLTPLSEPLVTEAERAPFRSFVVGLFSRRRKQIVRSLADLHHLSRETTAEVLASVSVDLTARVEVLGPETLVRLFRAVFTL